MRSPVALALVCLLAAPALLWIDAPTASADDVLVPTKEYSKFFKLKRRMSPEEQKRYATDYVAKWKATGQKTTGARRYALAQFQQLAGHYKDAWMGFQMVSQDEEQKEKTRDYAASAEAGVLLVGELRASIGQEAVDAAVTRLASYAEGMSSGSQFKTRGSLWTALARLHDYAGRNLEAADLRLKVISADPNKLEGLLRPLVWGLRESTHKMDGYAGMQKQAAEAMKVVIELQSKKVKQTRNKLQLMVEKLRAISPDSLGPDGRLKKEDRREMDGAEKAVHSAQRLNDAAMKTLKTIAGYEGAFTMMGKPAPEWTSDREYGEVEKVADLKGKVVVLDFWLTSGQRSNFGVMRDLMKEFGAKAFTVVGVTASSHVCYETRWDIDEDFKHKVVPGRRKQYAARLANEMNPVDEGAAVYGERKYRDIEMEVIQRFIEAHELKWPHVLIDEFEPAEKYGLEGWPHLVVLDKQGRIRYVKAATLTRDKTEDVARIRKVIKDLLAE